MSRPLKTRQNDDAPLHFACNHCRTIVLTNALGTQHRNHCPHCLWSRHVDNHPGDRRCACQGDLEPIAIWARPDAEWAIVHRCRRCFALCSNRIAGDDDPTQLLWLAARPLSHPAFSVDLQKEGSP